MVDLSFEGLIKELVKKYAKELQENKTKIKEYSKKQISEIDIEVIEGILNNIVDESDVDWDKLELIHPSFKVDYEFDINEKVGIIGAEKFTLKGNIGTKVEALLHGHFDIGPMESNAKNFGVELMSMSIIWPDIFKLIFEGEFLNGGGRIELDSPNYNGVIEISIKNIDLDGITVFKTDPFDLFISLTAFFDPGIDLGYGFNLMAVGGILAFNHSINDSMLIREMNKDTLRPMLFPEDPIKNYKKIFISIKRVFPVKKGHHVFGPVAQITWGKGGINLIELDVGLFFELKTSSLDKILVLGRATIILPDKEKRIIDLKMNVIGKWDLGNKEIMINAVLFNSKILKKFEVSGEMILYGNYGNTPEFIISVGGFHPRFDLKKLPSGFPAIDRMKFFMGTKNKKFTLTSYLALTSNSFQFGADADLYLKWSNFKVTSNLGFDVLIEFEPLYFDVDVRASASIKWKKYSLGSVTLNFNLTGPNQFVAKGKASFSVWIWDVSCKFTRKWGTRKEELITYISPADVLRDQLIIAEPHYISQSWGYEGVIFTDEAQEKLSALGEIIIEQSIIPLEFEMDKYSGSAVVEGEKKLIIDVTEAGDQEFELSKEVPVSQFMPSQFENLTDDEKLNMPSFVSADSGVRIKGGIQIPTTMEQESVEYESVLLNPEDDTPQYIGIMPIIISANITVMPFKPKPKAKKVVIPLVLNNTINPSLFLNNVSSLQGRNKYFKPVKRKVNKSNPNFIKIEEPTYNIIENNESTNLSYNQARKIMKKGKRPMHIVKNSVLGKKKRRMI